jgi:uncharacterized protein (TIGR03435 family)
MVAWGQAVVAPVDSSAKTLTYEVVSIKPDKSGNGEGGWFSRADGFEYTNMPLLSLFYSAYGIIVDGQVSGLPAWVRTDPYDVEAKVDANTAEAWKKLTWKERSKQEQPMLRLLLADRCHFRAHEETGELPVYDLVIAKSGLRMKEAPPNENATGMFGNGKITAHGNSVESIVYDLSGQVGRIIVDKTGLGDKKFDFELKWAPDDQRTADNAADAAPSIFTALEEQLGLKLVPDKGPVEVLVIDHMERPSAN